jgi:hypothetical protein
MAQRTLGLATVAATLAIVAGAPPAAAADGFPVPSGVAPDKGAPGVDGSRYVTRSKDGTTTIRELGAGGAVLQTASLRGTFAVPAVALDGSPGGLSGDGSTLVLTKPRSSIPQTETHLLIIATDGLGVRDRLTLHGDFGFDAISPDGSHLYLIEYLSARDPTRYAVRAYDTGSGELLPDPIVDPTEEDPDEMRGYPITRAASPDRRWAYTLYDGGGEHPFIHALDTSEGRAVCIDTPSLGGRGRLYQLGLGASSDGSTLTVSDGGRPVALVDTQTFEVRGPSEPAPAPRAGDGDVWRLAIPTGAVVALAGAALLLIARRRHRGLAPGNA